MTKMTMTTETTAANFDFDEVFAFFIHHSPYTLMADDCSNWTTWTWISEFYCYGFENSVRTHFKNEKKKPKRTKIYWRSLRILKEMEFTCIYWRRCRPFSQCVVVLLLIFLDSHIKMCIILFFNHRSMAFLLSHMIVARSLSAAMRSTTEHFVFFLSDVKYLIGIHLWTPGRSDPPFHFLWLLQFRFVFVSHAINNYHLSKFFVWYYWTWILNSRLVLKKWLLLYSNRMGIWEENKNRYEINNLWLLLMFVCCTSVALFFRLSIC